MARGLTDELRAEYNLLFSRMAVRPEHAGEIERIYQRAKSRKAQAAYAKVEAETGVPWVGG